MCSVFVSTQFEIWYFSVNISDVFIALFTRRPEPEHEPESTGKQSLEWSGVESLT